MQALFLVGLNDRRAITVTGYDERGELRYNWKGNSPFHRYLDMPPREKTFVSIVWNAEPDRQLSRPDIVINCINDADSCGKSLRIATDMTQAIKARWPDVPVFNDPAKIFATKRDDIFEAFGGLPGLFIPKVVRFRPESVDDVLQAAAREIRFPFLIRSCGAHQAEDLQRIAGPADRARLERYAYDGGEFYLTSYVDYAGEDGFYRKGRLVIIGGEVFARHYMTGENWLVHGGLHDDYMALRPETRIAEENFVKNFRSILGEDALSVLMAVYDKIGLDYLGFDFAILPDGRLLIFEINAAQNAFLDVDFNVFPYMKPVRDAIIAGLNHAFRKKLERSYPSKSAS